MSLHCAICVNTAEPPWPEGTHTHAGYQLCETHHTALCDTSQDSTIIELINHAGRSGPTQ